MQVVAVSHPKGGVAKTTSAAALAGALVRMGHRVLVVDLDPQSSLTLALGHLPNRVWPTLAEVLQYRHGLEEAVHATQVERLDLIPASPKLALVQRELHGQEDYTVLRARFRSWLNQSSYDYVLLDTPPGQGVLTLNALILAQLVLIPTQPEYFSAYALRYLLQTIRWVRLRFQPLLAYQAFLTMYQSRNRAHAWIRARLEVTLGPGLCRTVIPLDTKVREAAIAGLPVTHFAPKSRAARAYLALAQEVFTHEQQAAGRVEETAGRVESAR